MERDEKVDKELPIRAPDIRLPHAYTWSPCDLWIEENIARSRQDVKHISEWKFGNASFSSCDKLIEYILRANIPKEWKEAVNEYLVEKILLEE